VVIESDGLQTKAEGMTPPTVTNYEELVAAVKASGLVGMGGAGFPTAVKLTIDDLSKVKAVIVNGAECEPYITSDTRTMIDDADLVWEGMQILHKYLQPERTIIGIESNKPECIKIFEEKVKGQPGFEVHSLPSLYPQGGEKVLVYNTIGAVVEEGKLPLDAGAVVINCTTVAMLAKYLRTGEPPTEKCVTIDGSAVANPGNVIAPVGTPIKELFDFCGGFKEEPKKIICGGAMMGIATHDLNAPLHKNHNGILALNAKDATPAPQTACIKCGRCIAHCPLSLMPADIETAFNLKKGEDLEALKVNLCMECGCCSFVCPAKRPLVQVNKLAKVVLRDYQTVKKAEAEKAAAKAAAKQEKEGK